MTPLRGPWTHALVDRRMLQSWLVRSADFCRYGTIKQANRFACPPIQQRLVRPLRRLHFVRGRRIPIAMNVMTLFEQTDRALTLYVNQFAGRSMVLDKFVYDILDTSLLNGGVFLAAYWWLWFEADESGVPAKRRNVAVALLAVIGVAAALKLLKVHLPFRYRPLNDPDLGLRLPFGVDPVSLNHFSSFPSGHAMLFFALSVPLWIRSRWLGAAAAGWTLLAICSPLLHLGDHGQATSSQALCLAWRSCSYCAGFGVHLCGA